MSSVKFGAVDPAFVALEKAQREADRAYFSMTAAMERPGEARSMDSRFDSPAGAYEKYDPMIEIDDDGIVAFNIPEGEKNDPDYSVDNSVDNKFAVFGIPRLGNCASAFLTVESLLEHCPPPTIREQSPGRFFVMDLTTPMKTVNINNAGPAEEEFLRWCWSFLYHNADLARWALCLATKVRGFELLASKDCIDERILGQTSSLSPFGLFDLLFDLKVDIKVQDPVPAGYCVTSTVGLSIIDLFGQVVGVPISGQLPIKNTYLMAFPDLVGGTIKICGGNTTWKNNLKIWTHGTDRDKMCAIINFAASLLHELTHICGLYAPAENPGHCNISYLTENTFRWAAFTRFPDAVSTQDGGTCCTFMKYKPSGHYIMDDYLFLNSEWRDLATQWPC